MPKPIPDPLKITNVPWVVHVLRREVEGGLDPDLSSDRIRMADLWEQVEAGQMSEEEYDEAIGPTPGYRPYDVYGPYTQQQAERLAEHLNEPEAAAKYRISAATPALLTRFFS